MNFFQSLRRETGCSVLGPHLPVELCIGYPACILRVYIYPIWILIVVDSAQTALINCSLISLILILALPMNEYLPFPLLTCQ